MGGENYIFPLGKASVGGNVEGDEPPGEGLASRTASSLNSRVSVF